MATPFLKQLIEMACQYDPTWKAKVEAELATLIPRAEVAGRLRSQAVQEEKYGDKFSGAESLRLMAGVFDREANKIDRKEK